MKFFGSKIVFNQTWEDFDVDKELLKLKQQDVFLTITSGGCNVLNACLLSPHKIFSVDDNPAQNHLLRLKIASIKTLNYREFWALFGAGQSGSKANVDLYFKKIRIALPYASQVFWDQNIKIFESGIFKAGSLRTLSLLRACIKRLCGAERLDHFSHLKHLDQQAKYYFNEIEPRLWQGITSYMPTLTMIAYGTHLRQILFCYKAKKHFLKDLYKDKQKYLFTNFPIKTNHFWYQIIFGKYFNNVFCPDYLKEKNFNLLKRRINTIEIFDCSLIDFLKNQADNSINKFSISDVIEFLPKKQAEKLWTEIIRTAKNGSLISYRSFAPNILPPGEFDSHLRYFADYSQELTPQERTASYSNVYKLEVIK